MLTYERFGVPGAPVVLVVHGMAENRQEVMPIARVLGDSYDVVVPDLPGHGETGGGPEGLSIQELGDALAVFCEGLGVTECAVVGHSMGGTVGVALAQAREDLVTALVLVDPGMAFPDEVRENLSALYEGLTAENFHDTLWQTLPAILFGPEDGPDTVDRVMGGMTGIGLERFVALGRGLVPFDGFSQAARVRAPMFMIVNDNPLPDLRRLQAAAPGMAIVEIPGLSHQGIVSDSRVHQEILAFLDSSLGSPAGER